MVNVILTQNKTCKTKLQCCALHFTLYYTRPSCDWYFSICEQ